MGMYLNNYMVLNYSYVKAAGMCPLLETNPVEEVTAWRGAARAVTGEPSDITPGGPHSAASVTDVKPCVGVSGTYPDDDAHALAL